MKAYPDACVTIPCFFIFSDESGAYMNKPGERTIQAHPFYVRASIYLSVADYALLQLEMSQLKSTLLKIDEAIEVKWSHYGNKLKNAKSKGKNGLTYLDNVSVQELESYFSALLSFVSAQMKSIKCYFTLSDNSIAYKATDVKFLRMHIQDHLQRSEHETKERRGFACMFVDDMGNRNKDIRDICNQLLITGDFVNYRHLRKSISIDYSHQCAGLQLADICAGVFTANLKATMAVDGGNKFGYAKELMDKYLYKIIRNKLGIDSSSISYHVYRYGIDEVPNGRGDKIAKEMSKRVEGLLMKDFERETHEDGI